MKVETKYNIGDTFWTLGAKKAVPHKVRRIQIDLNEDGASICRYGDGSSDIGYGWLEQDIFPTKEELLKSL